MAGGPPRLELRPHMSAPLEYLVESWLLTSHQRALSGSVGGRAPVHSTRASLTNLFLAFSAEIRKQEVTVSHSFMCHFAVVR